jgi:hypothetical protein
MNSTFSCLAIDSPGVTAATISSIEKEQMPPRIRDPGQKDQRPDGMPRPRGIAQATILADTNGCKLELPVAIPNCEWQ